MRNDLAKLPSWAAGLALAGFTAVFSTLGGAEAGPGGTYADWQRHREAMGKMAGLLRYHTFECPDPAAVPNELGAEGTLIFRPVKNGPAKPGTIPGRWPEKKAVRLDGECFEAPAFAIDQAFSVMAWVRLNGQGVFRGNNESTNGTLFSSGTGYTDGWRLTINHPARTLAFSLGRPVERSHSVTSTPVAPETWQHVAFTWDGSSMQIYIDGLPAARSDYSRPYTPAKSWRIGFANHGVGSVRMDIDEVAVFGRALAVEEVVRLAHFYSPLIEKDAAQMISAVRLSAAKDYPGAADIWRALGGRNDLAADYRALALLELSRCLVAKRETQPAAMAVLEALQIPGVAQRHSRNAELSLLQMLPQIAPRQVPLAVYQRLQQLEGLSEPEQIVIWRQLAQRERDAGAPANAVPHYRKILGFPALSLREQLDARLQIGHAWVEARDYGAARREYEAVLQSPGLAAHYRVHALFCLADASRGQGDLGAARECLAKAMAVPQAPAHLVQEAEERTRELDQPGAKRASLSPALAWPKPAVELFVAPGGREEHPGTEAQPFASLEKARDAIRALKKAGGWPAGGVIVWLRGGSYPVRQPFRLSREDSGTESAPVVYSAYPKESVRLTGGVALRGFRAVSDPQVIARLPEEGRGKVLEADLRGQGIEDLGSFEAGGYASGRGFRTHPLPWVYWDHRALTLARWPNQEDLQVGELLAKESAFEHRGVPGTREGVFTYSVDRPLRWKEERDAWLYGFWFHDWADSYEKVAAIDPGKRSITLAAPFHRYGYRQGQRYYAVNLLAEVDQPGEWYLDRSSGKLYVLPPSPPETATVEFSLCPAPLVELDQASHVRFRGLTWELGRGDGVVVKGGNSCILAGCTVRKCSGNAVSMSGDGHQLLGCDLYELGRGGITLTGGDRKTLRSGGNVVENCHIHHLSWIDNTYTPAVLFRGVGARVAHNRMSHVKSSAMRIEGNDCLVECNEVHDVVQTSDDQGGVDMFGNPSYRGNVYRYNYWHHIGNGLRCGQAGIRLDDAISGTLIYGNVFYRCSDGNFGGVQIHGGKDNIVDNNVFIDCRSAVSFSPWGETRWQEYLARPDVQKLLQEQVDITKPPYSTRYPELADLKTSPDVNRIWRNLVLNCGQFLARDRGIHVLMDNRLAGADLPPGSQEHRRFPLPPDSPFWEAPGMRPIPLEDTGLYADSLRASWPVPE